MVLLFLPWIKRKKYCPPPNTSESVTQSKEISGSLGYLDSNSPFGLISGFELYLFPAGEAISKNLWESWLAHRACALIHGSMYLSHVVWPVVSSGPCLEDEREDGKWLEANGEKWVEVLAVSQSSC